MDLILPVPLLSCITIGPPIWLEKGEPKGDFLERARESVNDHSPRISPRE